MASDLQAPLCRPPLRNAHMRAPLEHRSAARCAPPPSACAARHALPGNCQGREGAPGAHGSGATAPGAVGPQQPPGGRVGHRHGQGKRACAGGDWLACHSGLGRADCWPPLARLLRPCPRPPAAPRGDQCGAAGAGAPGHAQGLQHWARSRGRTGQGPGSRFAPTAVVARGRVAARLGCSEGTLAKPGSESPHGLACVECLPPAARPGRRFTTHTGTVAAADEWDSPVQLKAVRKSLPASYEHLFHK